SLHIADMVRVRGTDKVIVGNVTRVPGCAEGHAHLIGKRLRSHARVCSSLGDLVTVLIGAGEIKGLPPACPVVACQGVGDDHGIGAAQVRVAVDVIERGCEVDAWHRLALVIEQNSLSRAAGEGANKKLLNIGVASARLSGDSWSPSSN